LTLKDVLDIDKKIKSSLSKSLKIKWRNLSLIPQL
jgi:hypothetical protein